MVERRLWFFRRNGVVKGPFIPAQITRNILLGRIKPDDELSLDEQNWQQVATHRELYPDVMRETPADSEKIDISRMQLDERVSDQRRDKQNMEQERRRSRERRANESDAMLEHRQHRKEIDDAYKNNLKRPKTPFLSLLLIAIVIIGFGVVLKPENKASQADCASPPAKGVNWANCRFISLDIENQNLESAILTDAILNESRLSGVNFAGSNMAYAEISRSDLSYSNLEDVRLIGADLRYSDLSYADLKDADFSYADLSNALLAGANMVNTKFDNAIWIDGRVCSEGSTGACY